MHQYVAIVNQRSTVNRNVRGCPVASEDNVSLHRVGDSGSDRSTPLRTLQDSRAGCSYLSSCEMSLYHQQIDSRTADMWRRCP